jgi:hypothetical protein
MIGVPFAHIDDRHLILQNLGLKLTFGHDAGLTRLEAKSSLLHPNPPRGLSFLEQITLVDVCHLRTGLFFGRFQWPGQCSWLTMTPSS